MHMCLEYLGQAESAGAESRDSSAAKLLCRLLGHPSSGGLRGPRLEMAVSRETAHIICK